MKSISYRYLKYKNLKEYKRLLLLQDLLLNFIFPLKGLISDIKREREIRIEVSFLIRDVPAKEHPGSGMRNHLGFNKDISIF